MALKEKNITRNILVLNLFCLPVWMGIFLNNSNY